MASTSSAFFRPAASTPASAARARRSATLSSVQLLLGDGGLRLSVAILVAVLLVLLAALAILGALLVLAVLLALALAVLSVLAVLVLAALLAVAAADHRRGGALAARSLLGLGGIGGRGRLGRAGARCGRLGALGLLGLRGLLLRAGRRLGCRLTARARRGLGASSEVSEVVDAGVGRGTRPLLRRRLGRLAGAGAARLRRLLGRRRLGGCGRCGLVGGLGRSTAARRLLARSG